MTKKREKGVATAPCPSCGQDLPLRVQPDGGVATESCSTCYPSAAPEIASADAAPPTREVGTVNTEEDNDE